MPDEEIILLETYCSYNQVEPAFLETLESHGLIVISYRNNQRFILIEDLHLVEMYSRLYYELSINVPGIDALNNMLEKIRALKQETENLKARLRIYE